MNKTTLVALATILVSSAAMADDEMKVTADRIAADQRTGSLVASGRVDAVVHPFHLLTEELRRDANNVVSLSSPTILTTCTNDVDHLHWRVGGDAEYQAGRYVMFRDMWVHLWETPVMWLPYWYYPFDTDYGLRMMPGYSTRWGAYLLTKYVYHIAGDPSGDESTSALRGATRLDLRTKNGVAVGQSLRWRLGDFGTGYIKGYYAADEDFDRYRRHWNDVSKWNYQNWGSEVSRNRYAFQAGHRWEPTERDILRVHAAYYSDSYFWRDFLRDRLFSLKSSYVNGSNNEAAWEHNESLFGLGVSVTGSLNDFYGGTAKLPEFYLDIIPQPVFGLPVNYESQTRVGYLDRRVAKYGTAGVVNAFNRMPGPWAEFNTFRLDTYHRLTAPMKFADVLSVVPRVGFRGTYWGDSGYESLTGWDRAYASGDDMSRFIVEGGITFAARGTAWIDDRWQHMIEPYADVLVQEAEYSGDGDKNGRRKRPYLFDALDGSMDWQDQFAGRSRNLPYSWYGVTPGLRNALRKTDDRGNLRTIFDLDVYAAIQFNDASYTAGNRYHRLAALGDPNYGRHSPEVVPGARLRWFPIDEVSLSTRAEYDSQNNTLAYANLEWRHRLTRRLKYNVAIIHRNYRWWDYSSSPYDPLQMRDDELNMVHFSYVDFGFEYDICDAIAIGPYVRWDIRYDDLEEVGTWIDYRTDCLGFRFQVAYENEYKRIDNSKSEEDWRFGFFMYLRAFGPDMSSILGD